MTIFEALRSTLPLPNALEGVWVCNFWGSRTASAGE